MRFTDIFINRPVLATVVSLVILLLGARAFTELTVRQYPEMQNAQINVTIAYPGAGASLVEGFITTPVEREIAAVDGIEYLVSNTGQGATQITANLRLDKNPNEAMTEISAKVNKLRNEFPEGSEDPVIAIAEAGGTAAMYLSFFSEVLNESQITDYLTRIVEPQLATLNGVERARIIGARTFSMRVWLKPDRLVGHNITASEVIGRLRAQNVLSAVGETRGNYVKIAVRANTDLNTPEQFRQLVVKSEGNSIVRLADVADVVLGAENYDQSAGWNGSPAIPADTGRLHGAMAPLMIAAAANGFDVRCRPRYVDPGLEGWCRARFRVRPVAIAALIVGFLCSPPFIRAVAATWRSAR